MEHLVDFPEYCECDDCLTLAGINSAKYQNHLKGQARDAILRGDMEEAYRLIAMIHNGESTPGAAKLRGIARRRAAAKRREK